MPQLEPQFVARPDRSRWLRLLLLLSLAWPTPSPPPFFFIDETDAHGIGVETHLPMGLALFSMRYRINYYQLV